MDRISIVNETEHQIEESLLLNLVKRVLEVESKSGVELNVIIIDDARIKDINHQYRGIDQPTDVISFAFCDTPSIIEYDYELLGDIYISLERAIHQSEEYGHSMDRELGFLTVHGMYHLLGFDHQNDADTKIMRQKEEKILNETEKTKRA